MGHHALAWETTSLRNGELWLNGRMDEREGEWLERQMVSRHSLGKNNNEIKNTIIPSALVEMGHHALYLEAPLSMRWRLGLWSNRAEGG